MNIYANKNGDWWASVDDAGITVISEEDLKIALASEGYSAEEVADWGGLDKLERTIWNYGKSAPLLQVFIDKAKQQLHYLEEEEALLSREMEYLDPASKEYRNIELECDSVSGQVTGIRQMIGLALSIGLEA